MSGIAAIIDLTGRPVTNADIDGLAAGIAYRGTHPPRCWQCDNAALTHAALPTHGGDPANLQPLRDDAGKHALAFDGYLNNWEYLRRKLSDHGANLRDDSDAELVLHAYLIWGDACTAHIDGEFAFVIWDARKQQCFAARDHHGLRPFFYRLEKGRLVIASDLKAIADLTERDAQNSGPLAPNYGFLAEIMAEEIYSREETIWRGINRLTPAHNMVFRGDALHFTKYWQLPTDVRVRYRKDSDYIDHYRAMLTECTRLASRSHVPLAMDVSGGQDSSSLYCLAHELQKDSRLLAPSIQGYTMKGAPGSSSDEVRFARDAAEFVGGSLTEMPLFQPPLRWFTDQAASLRDVPIYTNGAISIDLERAAVANGCAVSVNGMGGDQWLDGTGLYLYQAYRSLDWRGITASLAADMQTKGLGATSALAVKELGRAVVPARIRRAIRLAQRRRADSDEVFWLSPSMRDELHHRRETFERGLAAEPLTKLKLQKHSWGQFQVAIEISQRQSSRIGLDLRSPMLSRAFMEFSAATPEHLRRRGGVFKYIHREAMRGIMPPSIVERHHEASFPEATHIQRELGEKMQGELVQNDCFDSEGIAELLRRYLTGSVDGKWAWAVWGAYCGAVFLQQDRDNRSHNV